MFHITTLELTNYYDERTARSSRSIRRTARPEARLRRSSRPSSKPPLLTRPGHFLRKSSFHVRPVVRNLRISRNLKRGIAENFKPHKVTDFIRTGTYLNFDWGSFHWNERIWRRWWINIGRVPLVWRLTYYLGLLAWIGNTRIYNGSSCGNVRKDFAAACGRRGS